MIVDLLVGEVHLGTLGTNYGKLHSSPRRGLMGTQYALHAGDYKLTNGTSISRGALFQLAI